MDWSIVISVVGIALLVVVSVRLGGVGDVCLASAEEAAERLHQDTPLFSATHTLLSTDGRCALLWEETGKRLAIVMSHGDKFITRVFDETTRASFKTRRQIDPEILLISFSDHTLAPARIQAPNRQAAETWRRRLKGE